MGRSSIPRSVPYGNILPLNVRGADAASIDPSSSEQSSISWTRLRRKERL